MPRHGIRSTSGGQPHPLPWVPDRNADEGGTGTSRLDLLGRLERRRPADELDSELLDDVTSMLDRRLR